MKLKDVTVKILLIMCLALLSIDSVLFADNTSPLCFTARNGSITVRFEIKNATHTIQYSTNGRNWSNYTSNTNVTINANQSIYFRASTNQTTATAFGGAYDYDGNTSSRFYFTGSNGGTVEASGNIMSLYGPDCPNLPLQPNAFAYMFYGDSITTAPALPSTSLASKCYYRMFAGCKALTTAPELPATIMASNCYNDMFISCESLIVLPVLPATTLASSCYSAMFAGCVRLTTLPDLPATTLASGCYSYMFWQCSSLVVNTAGPGTLWKISATTALSALTNMFLLTGGTMNGTPSVNTTYYIASGQYTVTANANDPTMGSVTGGGLYSTGDTATLTAVPNMNYRFRCWNDSNTANPRQIIVTQNASFTAIFDTIPTGSNSISFRMIRVEGGTFQMGSLNGSNDERPIHSVTLSDYFIGETEVTQKLWKSVMGSNPSDSIGDNLPVQNVSWNDCQTFISRLNILTGKTFALPTEAQWEFAARGGDYSCSYTYSGSNNLGSVAWYYDNCSGKIRSVATKQANELGLYDMSGNVWEWCQDWYGSYSSSSQSNPAGPSSGSFRVLRGGGCSGHPNSLTSTYRYQYVPTFACYDGGFRLALLNESRQDSIISITLPDSIHIQPANNPLCFTARNGIVTVRFEIKNATHAIQYSTDGFNWNNYTSNSNVILNSNQYVYFRAANNQTNPIGFGTLSGYQDCSRFYFSTTNGGTVESSGNIMSLFGPDCPDITLPMYAFRDLFNGCTLLTTTPSLPSTKLSSCCYCGLFAGCSSITSAPDLPATILEDNCYSYMFLRCSSLTEPPVLNATTLASSCYQHMFEECTALTSIPDVPATNLANSCCFLMFRGCTSLIVNQYGPGKQWIIPASTAPTDALTDVFTGTSGSMNGTPSVNTVYYVKSAHCTEMPNINNSSMEQTTGTNKPLVSNVRFEKTNGKYIITYDLTADAVISLSATGIYRGKTKTKTIYALGKSENSHVWGSVGYVMAGTNITIEWDQANDTAFSEYEFSNFIVTPKYIFNPTKTTLLGTFGYSLASGQMSYGVFLGYTSTKNGWGGFAHFRSDYNPIVTTNYECNAEGKINGYTCFYTGAVKSQYFMVNVGILYNMWRDKHSKSMISLGLGVGYGQRNVYWQMDSKDWALNNDYSNQGVSAELSLIGSINGFTLMAGVNTINFKNVELGVGIGITF